MQQFYFLILPSDQLIGSIPFEVKKSLISPKIFVSLILAGLEIKITLWFVLFPKILIKLEYTWLVNTTNTFGLLSLMAMSGLHITANENSSFYIHFPKYQIFVKS